MVWSQEKSIFLDTGEFIERIAMNRDRTHVVTGSRSGLKVISVDSNKIELKYDLRKVRRGGMHPYLDLAWNQLKDNLLASLLNGAILLWDLNYHQSSYPDQQFRAHKQAATAIAFSEFNEYLLVSGSKEGAIFLYDVRQREPSLSFSSYGKDTIRDIQFSTESKAQDLFVTADDSGTVRFWDIRRPDRMLKEFIAHTGFVSNVSLNPHLPSQYLVATAGRDRYVRVWDWSKPSPERVYTVEMIAGVSRVAWCPDNPWHLASCFVNDRNIYVWDVRRPHLPYAMYSPHTDGVSDMCWPRYNGSVCDRFVSSSKDGRVALSFTSHASRPLNHANTVALTCASTFDGVIVTIPERKRSSSCGSAADALDLFRRSVPSTIFCVLPYEIDTNISRAHTISFLAKHYKTSGGSVERLCTRNAEVAENAAIFSTPNSNRIGPYIKASSESEYDCGCVQLAFSWRTIALLCAGTELTNSCANICADTNAISGGLFSAALIRRKDLYRQPLLGRETSLDTNNLSSSDADEFGGVKISCTSGMRGANDIVLNGKFKSNAPDAIANDSVDSGSESDESSIESSSTSTIDDDQNILSAYMNAIDTMATLRHRRSGNGSRRQRRRALAAPTTLISGSLSQIAHNSLNADFFFGVNELNLYGMSANSASYGTCGRLSLKILENNASEFNELYSNIKDSQGRKKGRESRQSCNRKQ